MDNQKPVMVVGATGFLGMEVCRQLTAGHKKVQGLIRTTSDPVKVKALQDMGVQTVIGDMKDRISLDLALADAGVVISTASSTLSRNDDDSIETVDRMGQLNVVDAATDAGIKQFIFVSFLESPETFPLQEAKREVENRIIESGMTYTILRPTFFMEVWLSPHLGFDFVNSKAIIYGHGDKKISFISLRDVAAFAVHSLDDEVAGNSIIDLGGPEAVTPLQVVKVFEERKGHSFQLDYVSKEALRTQKELASDSLQQSFAALMVTYAGGAEVPMADTLRLFPLQLTSIQKYCEEMAGAEMAEA